MKWNSQMYPNISGTSFFPHIIPISFFLNKDNRPIEYDFLPFRNGGLFFRYCNENLPLALPSLHLCMSISCFERVSSHNTPLSLLSILSPAMLTVLMHIACSLTDIFRLTYLWCAASSIPLVVGCTARQENNASFTRADWLTAYNLISFKRVSLKNSEKLILNVCP